MQLVNISFRTLLIYRFLFYLLKKSACLFCSVSQSLDFSFIPVVAFNMLLHPLYSLIKLKFNFLSLRKWGCVLPSGGICCLVVSLLLLFPPSLWHSFLSISHLPDSWQGSQRLGVWSEELPLPGLLPHLMSLLPVYAVNTAFYSFGGITVPRNLLPGMGEQTCWENFGE